MSVPNQTPYIIYNANGLTTVFPFEFYIINAGDIQISLNGEVITTGYSVSGVGNVGGGDVTFLTPPANGTVVMLERVVPTYRLTDYQDNGDLLADTVNKDFDRLWMAIQRSLIYLGFALRRPLLGGPFDAQGFRIIHGADPIDGQDFATKNYVDNISLAKTLRVPESKVKSLPAVSGRRNKILAFDSQGDPITVMPESGSASDVLIDLAGADGLKYIGTCPDIATLRTIEPERDQQKIFVDFHTTGMKPTVSGDTGGGLFVADFTDSTSADDNGMVIVTAGGKRWKRDLQGKGYVTPRMFGAWMDAPYIDWSTIQATGYPRAPSMGAVDLTGVTNDGSALNKAYLTKLPIFIDQPIYIGDIQIDISQFRWEGISLNLYGINQQKSIVYTSGSGGFVMGSWGHNLKVKNMCFRNADDEYSGSPLVISGQAQSYGGGSEYDIKNNIFLHYKFALPLSCFVSSVKNNQAYDCIYGFGLAGTSTTFSSNWARHCDYGYLWGAAIDRSTYEPVNSPYPLMYVKATNIASDGCKLPHKFYQFRSLSIDGLGIEGVTGDHCLDFTDIVQQDATALMELSNISCDLKADNAVGVTHFISLPTNEQNGPTQVRISSGYVRAYKGIALLKNASDALSQYQGRGFDICDGFEFIKQTVGSSVVEDYARGTKYRSRIYGEHTGIGFWTGSDGTKLSASHQASNAVYSQVITENGTILMPFGRALDILIATNGEESSYTGGVFIAGEIKMIPINQNGLGGSNENGGIILFSVSAKDQATLSSSSVWSNKIAGNKLLDNVVVSKYNNGDQTILRVNFATATISQAILHITLTSQGMMHYYDKRWKLVTP